MATHSNVHYVMVFQSPANLEYDKIYASYLCAEETLKKKSDEIAKLSKKIEEVQRESSTQIIIYRQQVGHSIFYSTYFCGVLIIDNK